MTGRNEVLCVFNRTLDNVGPLNLGLGRPASDDLSLILMSYILNHTT